MEREVECAIERLALEHGRVFVKDGFADHRIRATIPNGTEYHIRSNGQINRVGVNFSIQWTQNV